MKGLIIYIFVINIITLVFYAADKIFAIKGMWRIPEKTLLGLAAIGGSVGALVGIFVIRHKSKHKQFYIGVPLMLAVQVVLLALFVPELIA